MSETTPSPEAPPTPPIRFDLTPRQRRLRVATLLLLGLIVLLIVLGTTHPFFHLTHPPQMTPTIRKALAVKGILILSYWTVCFLLAASLLFIAWLDMREVRLKLAIARRDIWRDVADRHQQEKQIRHEKRGQRRRNGTSEDEGDKNAGLPYGS